MKCVLMKGDNVIKDMGTFAQVPILNRPRYASKPQDIFFIIVNEILYVKASYEGAIAVYRYSST